MSVKSVRYFNRPRTMNSFNLIQALMSFAILITFVSEHMYFLTLMIVNVCISYKNKLDLKLTSSLFVHREY
jgi:hypothetical protein